MKFTDINFDVTRRLPEKVQPYALLMRLDRPIGWWLLLLPGWWSIVLASGGVAHMGAREWWIFLLFFMGAVVMRGAGCVVNDLWDRKLDMQVERTQLRPLASGAVGVKQAIVFLAVLSFLGLLILLQMNVLTIILGFLSIPLILIYPFMKRITWWPQVFLGLTFNFGALMGWAAVTGTIGLPAILLYAGGILWTLGYDTIYAHQDKSDDMMAGIKSTALLLGEESRKMVAVCYTIALVLFFTALVLSGQHWLSLLIVFPAIHAAWQVLMWDMQDPASSLAMFRANQIFGLLFLIACAV